MLRGEATYFVFTLLGFILYYFTYLFSDHWPPNIAEELSDGDVYDFIVVGSGSAGSPVAARLVERGQNVLLLEAGGKPPITSVIPGISFSNLYSDTDWQFRAKYDSYACKSYLNKQCPISCGKVLGGSSAINNMIYARGNKLDYDDWNVSSWTYEKMLPYFRRLESLPDYDNLPLNLKRYHNDSGPLKLSLFNSNIIPWRNLTLKAYHEIGLERNWDVNGPSQTGVTITHSNIYNGERQSTAEAYLVPNAKNKHLNVAYNSYVTKVIINQNNEAKGVRVSIDGRKEIIIKAKKEIIISTGAINTPKLLMLSGIGPKSELKRHGIQVHVDNPHVGQHLQDHLITPIILTANTGTATEISEFFSYKDYFYQWLYDRSGLLGTNLGVDLCAFVDTVRGGSTPDVQILSNFISRSKSIVVSYSLKKAFAFNDAVTEDIQELKKDSDLLILMPVILRPASRGSITLATENPYDHPIIHGNTLVEPEDFKTYLRAVRFIEKLLVTETFLTNNVTIAKLPSLKECNAYKFRSDEYWKCFNAHLGNTAFHPVGTASIKRVVNEKLCVNGINRLRIADTSVMRLIPRGNTNAATIALGERAADFILSDHNI